MVPSDPEVAPCPGSPAQPQQLFPGSGCPPAPAPSAPPPRAGDRTCCCLICSWI